MTSDSRRLLVIEDDPLQADIVTYRLQLLGYEVETADSTSQGWTRATEFRPDAILLDIDGARFEALDLIEQLASDVDTADVPLLAISTDADLDLVEKVWRAGAVSFLVAPFDPEMLEKKVEQMLNRVVSDQPVRAVASSTASSQATNAV